MLTSCLSPHTHTTAASSKFPAKTDSRAQSRRSSGLHSSWLQPIAVRRVWWRASSARLVYRSVEPVLQVIGELLHRQGLQPSGGQLDGERDAVQPPADPGHGRQVRLAHLQARHRGLGPVEEEPERVVRARRPDPRLGHLERLDEQQRLLRQFEGLTGGHDDPHAGGRGQDAGDEAAAGVQEVLAGVEEQQQLLVREELDEHLGLRPRRLLVEAENRRDRVGEQVAVVLARQLHQPGAARIGVAAFLRGLHRDP